MNVKNLAGLSAPKNGGATPDRKAVDAIEISEKIIILRIEFCNEF
jgi:hypothetical protein